MISLQNIFRTSIRLSRNYVAISEAVHLAESSGENSLQSLLKMSSRIPRWFENPFPDLDSGSTEVKTDAKALREIALSFVDESFAKGVQSGDGGLYVGAVGVTYMYLHIAHLLSPEERRKYLSLAVCAYQTQTAYNQENLCDINEVPGFLLGKAGFLAVGAVLGKEVGNDQMINECIRSFVDAANICKPMAFLSHGSDELFVGRAGYLCAALWLQQNFGRMPVPNDDLRDIWCTIVDSGEKYSKQHKSPSPLMYSYYGTEYLGAAHGLCSILQILLSFPKFLTENPVAEQLIKASVDYYLTLQDSLGNFPCAMDEIGTGQARGQDDMLVHWCHGAPGAIYMFARAYLLYKDKKYLDACCKCGEVVWTRGLLRKGPGICHGVAGSGYVFLVLHNLLDQKDTKYLYRALKFAEFISSPKFIREARRPDQPHSLYEGKAGTACFLFDLLQPENAEFPFFNLTVNYC